MSSAVDFLIQTAEAEIGYLEKASNKDLDSKTGNAGKANYTKYNRDLKAECGVGSLNAQWCQAFVDWCFLKAFGKAVAKQLIYTFTNYTPTGSNAFKKKDRYIKRGKGTPKRGDVIYFYSSSKGRIGHVGIVYKVSGTTVYTIEGNTSGASKLVTNGGGVCKKSYKLTSTYIDGYGRVDYSPAEVLPVTPGLHYSDVGEDVRAMQELLLKWNPKCLPEYGADGDFGEETLAAVKAFQKEAGVEVTGVYDEVTETVLKTRIARKVVVTGGSVFVRTAPISKGGQILGVVKEGEELPYQGLISEDGWYLVIWKNQNAWISGKYSELR